MPEDGVGGLRELKRGENYFKEEDIHECYVNQLLAFPASLLSLEHSANGGRLMASPKSSS